jgi:hypothetical protein
MNSISKLGRLTLFALLLAVPALAETMTNQDVVKLVKAGLSASTIEIKIETSETAFDVSTDGLVSLAQSGVSDTLIRTMLARQSQMPKQAASAAKPAEPVMAAAPAAVAAVPVAAPPAATAPAAPAAAPAVAVPPVAAAPAAAPAPPTVVYVPAPPAPVEPPKPVKPPKGYPVQVRNPKSGNKCSTGFVKVTAEGIGSTGCLGNDFKLAWNQLTTFCLDSSGSLFISSSSVEREISATDSTQIDGIRLRVSQVAPDVKITAGCTK